MSIGYQPYILKEINLHTQDNGFFAQNQGSKHTFFWGTGMRFYNPKNYKEITDIMKKKIKILLNNHVSGNIWIFWGRALFQCASRVIT